MEKLMGKKKQRAVTLVETVVAMALIVIVSASVFITCSYSIKNQNNNRIKHFFINETENVAMCYYSDNFNDALLFLVSNDDSLIYRDNENECYNLYYDNNLSYTNEDNATYKITIDLESELSITCVSLESGNNIYTYGGQNEK